MAYCIECGNALPLGAKFCPNCGEKALNEFNADNHLIKFEKNNLENTQSANNLLTQEGSNKIDISEQDDFVICNDNVRYSGELINGQRNGFGAYYNNYFGDNYIIEYEGEWERNFFKGNGIQFHYPGWVIREGYFDLRENYFKGKKNRAIFNEKVEIIGVKVSFEGEMSVDSNIQNSIVTKTYKEYVTNEDFLGAYNCISSSMLPHGYGISYYDDGTIEYEGYWKYGSPHGQGIYNFTDEKIGGMVSGSYGWEDMVIEGEFIDSSLVHGKITYENGDIHEGNFVEEELNGLGKITYENGDIHEGEFVDGILQGSGKIIFNSGVIHEGNFVDGELNGQGKTIMTNGNIIEGSFKENKINGTGKLITLDGSLVGEFENGLPIGLFVFTNNGGDKVEGEFTIENNNWNFNQTETAINKTIKKDSAGIR